MPLAHMPGGLRAATKRAIISGSSTYACIANHPYKVNERQQADDL